MSAAPLARPTDDEAINLCKMGQGHDCCRYLAVDGKGWSCLKLTSTAVYIDQRVKAETMTARADNCPGKGSE